MTIRPPRRLRRLTGRLVTAATLASKPYALYCDPQGCDSDDWGRPRGRYATLTAAMAAAGHPDAGEWETGRHCPDDVFTDRGGTWWSILAPGVRAEVEVLHAAEVASR